MLPCVAQVSGVRHATVSDEFLLRDCGGLAVRRRASQQSCCLEPNSGGTPTALRRGSAALERSCCLKPNGARSPTALSANRPTAAQLHCIVPRLELDGHFLSIMHSITSQTDICANAHADHARIGSQMHFIKAYDD